MKTITRNLISSIFIFILTAPGIFNGSVHALVYTKPNEPGPWKGTFVNTYTGNFFYGKDLLFIPGRGLDLDLTLYYNSGRTQRDWGFGHGWSFTYNLLYYYSDNNMIIERADGRKDEYTAAGNGFIPPKGVYDELTEYEPGKFLLSGKFGLNYYFDDDTHKKITRIEDRNGNMLHFTYEAGKLVAITDPSGRNLSLVWQNGHLMQIIDPNASPERNIALDYDDYFNLVAISDLAGHVSVYEYGGWSELTGITNASGNSVAIIYNESKAVSEIRCDAANFHKSFIYNSTTRITEVTHHNPNGDRTILYAFDQDDRIIQIQYPIGNPVIFSWDDANNIVAYTDAIGNTTSFVYDDQGNILSYTDPSGVPVLLTYESQFNQITGYTDKNGNFTSLGYDIHGNLTGLTDALGNVTAFSTDSYGNRIGYTDRNGFVTTFTYHVNGDLIGETDPLGNSLNNTYDGVGNLISSTDKNGNLTLFEYDALNQLISMTDPLGHTRSYVFDPEGNIISETNENGHTYLYQYDALDRVVAVTDPSGGVSQMIYDGCGNLISKTDASGHTTTFAYDLMNRMTTKTDPLGHSESNTYDARGNVISFTDKNGNQSYFNYDNLDRLTGIIDPSGNTEIFSYDPNGNRTGYINKSNCETGYTFDALNRLTGVTDPDGHTKGYSYDPEGNLISGIDELNNQTTFTYDALNQLVQVTDPLGYTELFTYDPGGNRISMQDRNGNVFQYGYDQNDRRILIYDPSGYSETFSYDPLGNLVSKTDQNGNITEFEYDPLDRMVLKMDALGHFSSLTYDPVGNLTAYTDRNGHTILYEYDEADRMTKKTDPMGYSEIFSYNPAGKVTGYTDKNGLTTVYAYDCCHLISSTSPLGYSEYYSYDPGGNLTSVTDRKGNTMYYAYDCLNRMISRTNALGNSFTYGYDPAGNKTEMNDPNAHQTQYTFDASGRMTSVMTPMGNTTQFTYDGAGNILSKTDPDGNVINYQYDPMHHLTEKSYPDGSSIEYIYDPAGNPVQLTHNGEPYDVTTNTYDAVNRLLTRTVDYSRTFTKTTQYSFDNEGNRTQMNSDGLITAWQYDAGDRLISITNPLNEITTYDYDSGGRRTGLTYPNGVYTTYLYDNENNLSDLAHYKASDELIMGFVYNYDLNGNRISVEERYATGTFTTNYGYNSLNNLMSAETSWGDTSQYTYDNVGNRSSLVKNGITTLYSYDADDRMLSEGMTTYAFDNNGNMVLKTDPAGTTHYSYDAENRLVHVVLLPANDTITYQYAASGERIGKKASPAELFGLNCYFCPVCCNYYCEISEGYDDYGNVQYAFTQGQQHDEHLGLMMGGSSYYYLSDGLGSVRALVDDQADVVQSYEYDPFGVITYAYGSVENPYRFTGREYEDQLAQYYYRARYYDPASGRFTSRDPKPVEDMAGSAGTMDCMPGMCGSSCEMAFSINEPPTAEAEMHPYAYVDNNPVNWVDPSGKVQNEGCSPIGKVEISTVCGPKEGPLYNCQPKNVTKDEYNWEESIEVNLGAEYRGVSIGVTTGHKKGERVETELQPCSATQFCVQVSCVCAYDYAKTVSRRFEELWDRTFHGNPLTLLELPDVYVYSWQCSLTGSHGWEPAPLPCDRPGCKCCEACQAKESNK